MFASVKEAVVSGTCLSHPLLGYRQSLASAMTGEFKYRNTIRLGKLNVGDVTRTFCVVLSNACAGSVPLVERDFLSHCVLAGEYPLVSMRWRVARL